jgi:hypothetical protein
MEQLITFKYINNMINLNFTNFKIRQVEIVKNRILILAENLLILYDQATGNFITNEIENIDYIKIHNDNIFLVDREKLIMISNKDLSITKFWDIGELFYTFCVYDFNNFNIEIIYANKSNEIKFFSKSYIFDNSSKVLYKEHQKVDKLNYENNFLIWSSLYTVKLFDMENKKMIFRKNFENLKIKSNSGNLKIDFLLFDKLLCLNIFQSFILLFKLDEGGREIFKVEDLNENIIGFWLNTSLTKLSVIKNFKEADFFKVKLEIYKLDTQVNALLHSKDFNILSEQVMKFSFSQKYSSVFIYDTMEIYHVTLCDKVTKMFNDLKANDININLIYEVFNKLGTNNEKFYVVNKIARNLNILKKMEIDESKIVYLFNAALIDDTYINSFFNILLKSNNFIYCFNLISRFFDRVSSDISENILNQLLFNKNKTLLGEYISKRKEITLSPDLLSHLENTEEVDEDMLAIYALLYIKTKEFTKGIDIFINQRKYDAVIDILLSNEIENMIFQYDVVLDNISVDKIVALVDRIFNKDTALEKTTLFINKMLMKDEDKSYMFIREVIEKEKFYLLFDRLIIDTVLKILFNKKDFQCIQAIIKTVDKIDYQTILNDYAEILKSYEFLDIKVYLLTKTCDYKSIIDIHLEQYKDAERCISLLESLTITEEEKQNLFTYLKDKIKAADYLSSIKKFYFITLFKDNIVEDSELIAEIANTDSEDDFKYILCLIEQLKLKVKILNYVSDLSQRNMGRELKDLKRTCFKGKYINNKCLTQCSYINCEKKKYKQGNEIAVYLECLHCYHVDCLDGEDCRICKLK